MWLERSILDRANNTKESDEEIIPRAVEEESQLESGIDHIEVATCWSNATERRNASEIAEVDYCYSLW